MKAFAGILTTVIAVATVIGAQAQAASQSPTSLNVCQNFMKCGEYGGNGVQQFYTDGVKYASSNVVETSSISEAGPNTIAFVFAYHREEAAPNDIFKLDLKLVFEADGRFTAKTQDGLYAVGICQFQNCTFDFVPDSEHPENTNTNTLIFKNGTLEHQMLATGPRPSGHATSVLNAVLTAKAQP